jgi:hypothetical protein
MGKSSECFRMTAGVKSGKAQNERMFLRFAPERGPPICALMSSMKSRAVHRRRKNWNGGQAWRARL